MKTPDPHHDPLRALARNEGSSADRPALRSRERAGTEEEFAPRYLSLPSPRLRGQGRRNLVWGVLVLFLSALLFAWALFLAGPAATYTVAVAFATGALLYIIARARLLRQRNGVFLAGALVGLLGVFLVLVQQAWLAAVRTATAVPVAVAKAAPTPAPATPALSAPAVSALIDAFPPSPAKLEAGPNARVARDTLVNVEGRPYRLREGDRFPVVELTAEEVRLAAGPQVVAAPIDAVRIDPPREDQRPGTPAGERPRRGGPENPTEAGDTKEITRLSQQDAVRKYPRLGLKNSPENVAFVEAVNELKFSGSATFFEDPEWPMRLADQLATREGWLGRRPSAPPRSAPPAEAADRPPLPDAPEQPTDPTPPERPAKPPGNSAVDELDLPRPTP